MRVDGLVVNGTVGDGVNYTAGWQFNQPRLYYFGKQDPSCIPERSRRWTDLGGTTFSGVDVRRGRYNFRENRS